MNGLTIMVGSLVLGLTLPEANPQFILTSNAFADGTTIPARCANWPVNGGKNISPPLKWNHPPAGTKSYALWMIDVHPVASNWVHWFVTNIPASISSIAEDASGKKMPKGCKELNNSFGKIGYGGPQPPEGSGAHPYVITLFALNVERLDLKPTATFKEFKKAIAGKALGEARLVGMFER